MTNYDQISNRKLSATTAPMSMSPVRSRRTAPKTTSMRKSTTWVELGA